MERQLLVGFKDTYFSESNKVQVGSSTFYLTAVFPCLYLSGSVVSVSSSFMSLLLLNTCVCDLSILHIECKQPFTVFALGFVTETLL